MTDDELLAALNLQAALDDARWMSTHEWCATFTIKDIELVERLPLPEWVIAIMQGEETQP